MPARRRRSCALVEVGVGGQQAADEAVPYDRQFLAALLVGLEVQHFHQQRTGRVPVVNAVRIVPSHPVAPVAGSPVVGIVPPPVGIVVAYEVGHFADVAELDAHAGGVFVLGARVARIVEFADHRADDRHGVGVFPVFGFVAVPDDQDTVGNVVGVDRGEVGAGIVGGVDQIIPVKVRCRRLLLTRAERNCNECERKVT